LINTLATYVDLIYTVPVSNFTYLEVFYDTFLPILKPGSIFYTNAKNCPKLASV